MKYLIFFLIISLFIQGNCKKIPLISMNKVNIEGFILRDQLGNQMGINGSAGNDWMLQDWSLLSPNERAYLNFSDNIDMSNTVVTTVNEPAAYPNPFTSSGIVTFYAADSVKVKLAVVNSSGDVLHSFAYKFKGYQHFNINYSDVNTYPLGKALRYYFSFSASAQANFKAGYGDVKKCKVTSFSNPNECFYCVWQ